ncbi:sensor histidine kinase [Streptomyces iconiensis]|uniref:histidine kinase n=1 Tax=Streptomyces iconiensis TaxID=1384038 RepID=A0ABT6ZTZ8_9ACTN|nr:histidine kinase [Streptomyces iconiensis]MDJ1131923.1 histidine kinase [Streptomyces iconiensis]
MKRAEQPHRTRQTQQPERPPLTGQGDQAGETARWSALVGRWHSRRATVQDGVLAGGVTVLAFVPQLADAGVVLGSMPERALDAPGVLLTVAQSLPLLLRRSRPLLCLALVTAAFAVHQALGYPPTVAGYGLYLALYSLGAHQVRFRLVGAAAFAVVYAALSAVLAALGSPEGPWDFAAFSLFLLGFAGAGAWIRVWRTGEAARRRYEARLAVSRERARIARELHDVVTHHVTAMVVQAEATQYLLDHPERVTEGLGTVSDTGRRALTELRHLLDVLDASDSPPAPGTPAVGLLDDLIDETRRAGQDVRMTQEGERGPMDGGVELAVYRIAQEGLTNARKHAPGRPSEILVRYSTDTVGIEVRTAGPEVGATTPGRGLTGLKERVGLLGGELRAGGREGGGFTVEACIPVRGAA